MKVALLGAALVAAALASPSVAQEVIYNPGYCAQFYPNANCQNKGPGNPYTGNYRRGGWHNGYARSCRGGIGALAPQASAITRIDNVFTHCRVPAPT